MKVIFPCCCLRGPFSGLLAGIIFAVAYGCCRSEGESRNIQKKPDVGFGEAQDVFAAVQGNDAGKLADLLEQGVSANVRNDIGVTPLMRAAWDGRLPLVEMLVKAGAKVNLTTENPQVTALTYASYKGHKAIVRLLRTHGATCSLIDACLIGDLPEVKARLGDDADRINRIRGLYGQMPIHAAVWRGHRDVVDELIRRGARLDVLSANFRTPLGMAVELGHNGIAKSLIAAGADVEMDKFQTPLVRALKSRNIAGAKLLLDAGAKPNASGQNRYTPLAIALYARDWETVELLLSHGADPTTAVFPAYTLEGSARIDQTFDEKDMQHYKAILKRTGTEMP